MYGEGVLEGLEVLEEITVQDSPVGTVMANYQNTHLFYTSCNTSKI